ncbi:Histidinol-phosphate aminotransferase [Pseudovibrio sp. W64]|uniref:histidinol-phosphate transaminase n=1 Tax=unclassified Pseudovibrio TaxID=2627060 RepID=UPI0007AECCBA|nr:MULTISPECIES: histidinol-phosphate transaminase [unclassified Pseudovibrio]KZK77787.1 Histidinol-phosphate aminotransferase [Pseudovibrio sp. W64]KZK99931.1 Histidinol-phosphate aminotransferase [Pseudovibrio sp. W74]KZL11761.1 Histidinol-phosphate aminotransferase [Pseudovibrio sp. Ad14]
MSRFWSPIVQKLEPYIPGEQPKQQTFIKLNTNENPWGPSPRALEAIAAATGDALRLYPDPSASDLRASIASSLQLTSDHIFAGNGSDEVLAHAFHAFFSGKEPILFPEITYAFYPTYCKLYSIEHQLMPLGSDFRINPSDFAGTCGGVVIANPNAPTGLAMPLEDIEAILKANPDVVVLVDEAYIDFGGQSAVQLVPDYDNLLVVQTFSKSRSLAGMRVGFAVGQPHLIEGLHRVKDSFNSYPLDRLSLAGALAAWEDTEWFEKTRDQIVVDREKLTENLQALNFTVLPSSTNFIFASHAHVPAERLHADLRDHGILVRYFKKERINDWLRISIGTSEECTTLVKVLRTML